MAIESFYISIELTKAEKSKIQCETTFQRYKKWTNDLIYLNALYIDNVDNEDGCWWHINSCYCNFFDSCNVLYELCLLINKVKSKFAFEIMGQKTVFEFSSLMEFMQYIYERVKSYKDNFNKNYGQLLIIPGRKFYRFRQKNKKNFINK